MSMNNLLNIFGIEPRNSRLRIPDEYSISGIYRFYSQKDIDVFWNIGEGYGPLQAGNMNNYFQEPGQCDVRNTIMVKNNKLLLGTVYEPRTFYKKDIPEWMIWTGDYDNYPEKWTIPMKSGKIVSKTTFKHGIIQVLAKLPNRKFAWPAIWFSGTESWPPEADLVEAYNSDEVQYASSNKIICKPNIHYLDKNGKHKAPHPTQRYVKHPDERFVTYTFWWEKEFIRMYYDGNLAYEFTDKEILKQFDKPMYLILNNAVEWGTKPTQKDFQELNGNFMEIKEVMYLEKI